jgi:hypothetical protein
MIGDGNKRREKMKVFKIKQIGREVQEILNLIEQFNLTGSFKISDFHILYEVIDDYKIAKPRYHLNVEFYGTYSFDTLSGILGFIKRLKINIKANSPMFPLKYVEKLRREASKYRTELKKLKESK